jgi:hypothetical protein
MKITEELLWAFAANRVRPGEAEYINEAMQKDKALAEEVERIRLLQGVLHANLVGNMERVPGNITLHILERVNGFEEKRAHKADNLLIYVIFAPLVLVFAGIYISFFNEAAFGLQAVDLVVPVMIVIIILVLLLSCIGARYILYRIMSKKFIA